MEEMYRKYHDVANIFPLINGEEFEELKQDIKANGLLEPIWLHPDDETIIDGRNRHRACCALGIQPTFRTWNGEGSLVTFVVSLNLRRRHLNSSQKAIIAIDILPLLEKETRERQRAAGAAGISGADYGELGGRGNKKNPLTQKFEEGGLDEEQEDADADPEPEKDYSDPLPSPSRLPVRVRKTSRRRREDLSSTYLLSLRQQEAEAVAQRNVNTAAAQAAAIVGTNRQYVADAKKLVEKAPELAEKVRAGELSIAQAKREVTKSEREANPPPPIAGKYRVWYVDPPWKYNDSGVIGEDNYGRAERHYPTMTITELCDMGSQIQAASEDDAVLFLWVTAPFLEESFQIVKAWGFKYKTHFIWDKVDHNFGHYTSVRHELLLICTRGSCTPDDLKLFDSVQVIERSDTHSEKPEQFRTIIETLYTRGNKIELFARATTAGWDTWGNEPNREYTTGELRNTE